MYMLSIVGQTAGPNGLNFLWKLTGSLGVSKAKKKFEFFFSTGKAGPFS